MNTTKNVHLHPAGNRRRLNAAALLLGSIALGACSTRNNSPRFEHLPSQDNSPPQTVERGGAPFVTARELQDEEELEPPTAYDFLQGPSGFDGFKLDLAARLFMALTGEYPTEHSDIAECLALHGRDMEYSVVASGPVGDYPLVLLAESSTASGSYPSVLFNEEDSPEFPEPYDELDPPLGLDDGMERYLLYVPYDEEYAEVPPDATEVPAQYQTLLSGLMYNLPSPNVDPATYPHSVLDPKPTPENYRLGVMLQLAWADIQQYQIEVSPDLEFTTLADLRADFEAAWGAGDDDAWENPYTGSPMSATPYQMPVAGNYSIVQANGKNVILIHYLDVEDGISSVSFGIAPPVPML